MTVTCLMAKLVLFILCQVSLVLGFYHSCTQCNDGEDQPNGLCRCDGDCVLFGDCCNSTFDLSTCESDTVVSPSVEFVCQSIFIDNEIHPLLNESYWMVSSCPDSWSTKMAIQSVIRENCTSLSSSLPPVTDLDTGIVYANEFCALCNRVENLLAWQPNLVCPSKLEEALTFSNIQKVLTEYPDIFKTQCQACSFQVPSNSVPVPARPCNVIISSCASIIDLEILSGIPYTEDEYTALVSNCINLPVDIVAQKSDEFSCNFRLVSKPTKLFKNEACAKCNGADMFSIQRPVELPKRKTFPNECVPFNRPAIPPLPIDRQEESVIDGIRNILSVPECISDIQSLLESNQTSSGSGESNQDESIIQPIINLTEHPPLSCSSISNLLSKCVHKYGRITSCKGRAPNLLVKKDHHPTPFEPAGLPGTAASPQPAGPPSGKAAPCPQPAGPPSGKAAPSPQPAGPPSGKAAPCPEPAGPPSGKAAPCPQPAGPPSGKATPCPQPAGPPSGKAAPCPQPAGPPGKVAPPPTASVNSLPTNSTENMIVSFIVSTLKEPTCFDSVWTNLSALGISCEHGPGGIGNPFTITLSGLSRGQVQLSVLTETVTVTVDCPEGQAALGLECRPTLCPEGYVESGGQCSFTSDGTMASCLSGLVTLDHSNYTQLTNNTVLYNDQIYTVINYTSNGEPVVCTLSSNLIDCPTGLVAVNTTEYKRLSNDTVLYNGEAHNVVAFDDFERAFICPPNETSVLQNSTVPFYPVGYFILTYIGCSLSVVGCVLVLLTYGLFKSLRTFPSLILMNLVVAILAESLLMIIGGPITEAFPSIEICTTAAIFLHFFFLAQFTWMSLMSFQMARTFYLAKKLIANSDYDHKDKNCNTFILYFFIGWGIPLFITLVFVIVDFTTESLVSYGVQSDGMLGSCWINHAESAIILFIVPLSLIMIINFILFILVTVFLCYAAQSSKKIEKKRKFQFFRINIAMFSVTGLAWIFGFIALILGTSWAWYPFILFTSSQGLTIFVAFLFTRHVLDLYRKLFLPSTSRSCTKNSGFPFNRTNCFCIEL